MSEVTLKKNILEQPEILESILLQLPQRDLLFAQKVSRRWKQLITSSPKIQETLFLRPKRHDSNSKTETEFNALLKAYFAPWYQQTKSGEKLIWNIGLRTFKCLKWNSGIAATEAFAREEASWRKMLPFQPVVRQLKVANRTISMGGTSVTEGELHLNEGVRMGVLYDLVQNAVRVPITSVGVKWTLPNESTSNFEAGDEMAGVLVDIKTTLQCTTGMPAQLGPEFKSLGYEEMEINWGERTHLRGHY